MKALEASEGADVRLMQVNPLSSPLSRPLPSPLSNKVADVRLMQELKSELKEVKNVNPERADKEGKKFLTAF